MRRFPRTALVLAALLAWLPRAAHAQLSADSLALAHAVAARIHAVYLGGEQKREPVLIAHAETPFDSAVSLALRELSGSRAAIRDSAHLTRVSTRGVIVVRDTAELYRIARGGIVRDSGNTLQVGTTVAVVVEERGSRPESPETLLSTWRSRYAYLFTRTPDGWRFVRAKELMHWDGGTVRDDPQPGLRMRKDGG